MAGTEEFATTDLAPYVDVLNAYAAWLTDPESDPALVLTVEEHYGVTFE